MRRFITDSKSPLLLSMNDQLLWFVGTTCVVMEKVNNVILTLLIHCTFSLFFRPICSCLYLVYRRSGNDIAIGAGGLRLNSRAAQIKHSYPVHTSNYVGFRPAVLFLHHNQFLHQKIDCDAETRTMGLKPTLIGPVDRVKCCQRLATSATFFRRCCLGA